MTLRWSIVHDSKLVSIQVDVKVEPEDVRALFVEMAAENALAYRKLVDLQSASLAISVTGIAGITKVIDAAAKGSSGPVAFVVSHDIGQEMAEVFGRKSIRDRPFSIFRDTESAMRWLDEMAG